MSETSVVGFPTAAIKTPIHARLVGAEGCKADIYVVRGKFSPIIELCQVLVECGYDEKLPMSVYRSLGKPKEREAEIFEDKPVIVIRSIGEAAALKITTNAGGTPIFAKCTARGSCKRQNDDEAHPYHRAYLTA